MAMDFHNHSGLPDWQVRGWFHARFARDFVKAAWVLPGACPSGLIPTSTVVMTGAEWLGKFRFEQVMGDIGCAMSWACAKTFDRARLRPAWNELFACLRSPGKALLGSGNHFIDACLAKSGKLAMVVHVGCRASSEETLSFNILRDYQRLYRRSMDNHRAIWNAIRAIFGEFSEPVHLPHDTVMLEGAGMVLRKGLTHGPPGAPALVASSAGDFMAVGKALPSVTDVCCSMSHGTGRRMSIGDAKKLPSRGKPLRSTIIVPDDLPDGAYRLETPASYRKLDDVLPLLTPYLEVTDRLRPVAFMGGF